MTTKVLQPLVLAIALCGLLEGQTAKQPPKAAPAAAASSHGGNPDVLSFHDAPIIVSDGSVSVTFDTTFFADLAQPSTTRPPALQWQALLDANPAQSLAGALISHTHATCSALSIPNVAPAARIRYQCPSNCMTSTDPVKHHLLVWNSGQVQDVPLQDCDNISIAVSPVQGAQGAPGQISIGMEFVAQFAHTSTAAQVVVMPPANTTALRTKGPTTLPVAQTMAWVVRTSPNSPQRLLKAAIVGTRYETPTAYRLQSVAVSRPNARFRPNTLSNGNGCSVIEITADSTFIPVTQTTTVSGTTSDFQAAVTALPARCH
jgi:hypothetical protein